MATKVLDEHTGKEVVVCGARKKSGEPCMNRSIQANGRCRYHGGNAPIGEKAPRFKDGKYSKILRRDILAAYLDAISLDDPYSMRDELALLDARLALLAGRAQDNDVLMQGVSEIKNILLQISRDLDDEDGDAILDEMRGISAKLEQIVTQIKSERAQWMEIYDVIDHRRKIVESERKREVDAQRMISEQQALVLISALVNTVKKHVTDHAALNAISADFNGLTNWQNGRILESQSSARGSG